MTMLYSIPAEWMSILTRIEEGGGEITPEIEADAQALIDASKDKIEAAVLAKRNLEIRAKRALAQAAVIAEEAEVCKAQGEVWLRAAERIGMMMLPALQITGKVQTPAGTAYVRNNVRFDFQLKPGFNFFDLPQNLWRQREPEFEKTALNELAKKERLPEAILAVKHETASVCLKRPTSKGATNAN